MDTEVAIVGAGPVGLSLATDLGWRGVACTVIEARAEGAAAFPTANHVSVRTMEHLRRLGLAREVASVFPATFGGHWIGITHLGGPEVARIENALMTPEPRLDSGFERAARSKAVPLRAEVLPEAAAAYRARISLVRPDGFVAWRGDEVPADPGAVLDIVRGA